MYNPMLSVFPADVRPAIIAVVELSQASLGESLRGIYAMGSLGYGSYVHGWSDLDIDVIVHDDGQLNADLLLRQGYELRDQLHQLGFLEVDIKCYSLAIINDETTVYEYGVANRAVMLLDSARLVYGEDVRVHIQRPSAKRLASDSRRLLSILAAHSEAWWETRPTDDVAALLALPGRLIFTARTQKVSGKLDGLKELLLANVSLPEDLWPWVSWAVCVRASPICRDPPPGVLANARRAARELITWARDQIFIDARN